MTDIVQAVSVFSLSAAGCLSMAKLMQTMERRRNARARIDDRPAQKAQPPRQNEDEDEDEDAKAMSELFPNGERRAVIRAVKDLRRENERRRNENQELKAMLEDLSEQIAAHLRRP